MTGGYSILKSYVSPARRRRQPEATMRFETAPGEQAQVDWGSLAYLDKDGKKRRLWVFVMTLGWSRACYVELVRRADTAAFIQCHVNAFEYLGGVPRRCLYDNAKVVTLGRDGDKQRGEDHGGRHHAKQYVLPPLQLRCSYLVRWPSESGTGRPPTSRSGFGGRLSRRTPSLPSTGWDGPNPDSGDCGRWTAKGTWRRWPITY